MASSGPPKRAGSRRGARPPRRFRPSLLLFAAGVTVAVVAWGYLVYAAVDFGSDARGGRSVAWVFLGLASLGAVACLFLALVLIGRLLRALGITAAPPPRSPEETTETDVAATSSRPPGGRRAAR